jgi:hypothetical protein
MVRKIVILLIVILVSCNRYRILPNDIGEPVLRGKAQYTFATKPSIEDLQKVGIEAYYVQVFEGRYYNDDEKKNPGILIFHNDGFFKIESLLYFGNFDDHRSKNSIYYGGKWRIIGNTIELEEFYPTAPTGNWYTRKIVIGSIIGDKIVFKNRMYRNNVYEKRTTLPTK